MTSNGWIGVDLDGTLAYYDKWHGIEHIGEPIAPIVNLVKDWHEKGITVKIFTARANMPEAIPFIETWCLRHLGFILPVTATKDFTMIMLIDDRCMHVITNTGRIVEKEPW